MAPVNGRRRTNVDMTWETRRGVTEEKAGMDTERLSEADVTGVCNKRSLRTQWKGRRKRFGRRPEDGRVAGARHG